MVAIMSGADNGFFYTSQVMHFSSPFTVFLIYHKHSDYIREIKKMKACTFAAYNEIDELWNRADRQFEKYARSNKKRLIKQILTDRFLIILCIIILLIIVTAAITQIFGI